MQSWGERSEVNSEIFAVSNETRREARFVAAAYTAGFITNLAPKRLQSPANATPMLVCQRRTRRTCLHFWSPSSEGICHL